MIRKIVFLFTVWRIFLFLPLIVSEKFFSVREGYPYTQLTYFLKNGSQLFSFLLYPFGNFDGAHYLLISSYGYNLNAGFFPLFPLTLTLFSRIFGQNILPFEIRQYIAATILVNIFFLISLIIFYRLIRLDLNKSIAIWPIIFLLIFPTSFFFASFYSEGLFLLLSLLSFYFARKKKWFLSGLMGMFLSATRLVGIAIWPSLLYEYFKNEKDKSFKKLISICLVPIGLIAYALYNLQKWGNPFYFIQAQGNFANNRTVNSVILFPQTIFRYLKILFTVKLNIYEWWVALFELSFFLFASVLFYVAWKKKIRASYLIFGLLCFLVPISSGTFSGLPRYILSIFPLFIALALIKNKVFKIIYCGISLFLLFLFFLLFSKGYFIS